MSVHRGGVPAPNFRGGACSKFSGGVPAPNFGGCLLKFSGGACSKFSGGSPIFGIRSTFGRYASYWNAFLFKNNFKACNEGFQMWWQQVSRTSHLTLSVVLMMLMLLLLMMLLLLLMMLLLLMIILLLIMILMMILLSVSQLVSYNVVVFFFQSNFCYVFWSVSHQHKKCCTFLPLLWGCEKKLFL